MEQRKYENLLLVMIVTVISFVILCGAKIEGQERQFPNKPIELIINMTPGGPLDLAARIFTNELTKDLGVPISIQYKPGAGGLIGASYVTISKPDGYTLLATASSAITAACFMEKEFLFDPLKDLTPVAHYAFNPNLVVGHSSSNLTSFDALVKFAKEKPGTLNCATVGIGSAGHLVLEVLRLHGVDITHVPVKGAAPAVTNLLGKHVDLTVLVEIPVLPHVKSGELRILATTNKMLKRPEVPSLAEKGFPEAEAAGVWWGIFAPPNLPKPIFDKIANSFQKVLQMPTVVADVEKLGIIVEYKGPDEFKKKIAAEYVAMEKLFKAAGLGKFSK